MTRGEPYADSDDDGRLASLTGEAAPTIVLDIVRASSFAGKPVPPRPWLVNDLIPDFTVTLLSGDGGVGKSLLAMQLGVAVATASGWIGTMPEFGVALYVSVEDDVDEVNRRLVDITTGVGLDVAALDDFRVLSLAGMDAVMGAPDRKGIIAPTALWSALVEQIATIRPRLLILDNLADMFAGNENSRPEARQFIGMLRSIAIKYRLAVLLLAHPSLSGLNSGSGTSGSTAWSNSVRSRLYLDRVQDDGGGEVDPALRVLKTMKSNYSASGGEIRLKWDQGLFRPDGLSLGGYDRAAAEVKAENVFVELLTRLDQQGRDVSHKPSPTFAPSVFAKQPDNGAVSKRGFEQAMARLFQANRIKIEVTGPPSRPCSRIVLSTGECS